MVIGRSAEATYWEFFRADQAKDANAWSAVMSYPHVRVAAPGRIEIFQSEEEFVASADWTQREATGWVRTEGINPQAIQTTRKKRHLAGGWTRYDVNDQPILSNRVVYVLTKPHDTWGIQARFACGATASWQESAAEEPVIVVKRFLYLLKEGDINAAILLIRFPLIVVGNRTVRRFETEASFTRSLPRLNLTPIEIDNVTTVQSGATGANIAASFHLHSGDRVGGVFLIAKSAEASQITGVSVVTE